MKYSIITKGGNIMSWLEVYFVIQITIGLIISVYHLLDIFFSGKPFTWGRLVLFIMFPYLPAFIGICVGIWCLIKPVWDFLDKPIIRK